MMIMMIMMIMQITSERVGETQARRRDSVEGRSMRNEALACHKVPGLRRGSRKMTPHFDILTPPRYMYICYCIHMLLQAPDQLE